MHRHTTLRGFTIVELLIVIVVIAILAAIATVAYSGMKNRADAAAITSHIRQYASLLEAYIVDNGRAPAANWRCLGDATTLPAGNGYEVNFCFKPAANHDGSNPSTTAPADPALMAQLGAIMGQTPKTVFPEVITNTATGAASRGMVYDGSTNNFANFPAVITYFTNLNYCPIGDKVAFWTAGNPSVSGCAYRLSVNENGVPR